MRTIDIYYFGNNESQFSINIYVQQIISDFLKIFTRNNL